MKMKDLDSLNKLKEKGLKKYLPNKIRIAVGMGTCGIGNGAKEIFSAFEKEIARQKLNAYLTTTGCFGFCAQDPLVNIYLPGMPLVILHNLTDKDIKHIVSMLLKKQIPHDKALCKIEKWDHITSEVNFGSGFENIPNWNEVPFFKWQKKIVLRNCGLINPNDIEEYIAVGGYSALYKTVRKFNPTSLIEEVKKSKLRGRGGAGFPTGRKWELIAAVKADEKYLVCNADEGDPGAYMNRNEIESDPHMLIEGMIIGAYATGANKGVIYIREEYPLAVERLKIALGQAEKTGLLGKNIFGSNFSFDIEIVEGAGAFVCGEETALIASIEGKAGRPRPRPPFPAQKGIWGKPTNINNVETLCNIPVVVSKGGEWFTKTGTQNSAGTKVFSLVGKIKNTGLVELPLGQTLQTLIYNIGGGTGNDKQIKAIQSGGPSGGCVPRELFNTPIDYESLAALGAIMGSGGMVVMDEDNCMVDVARYFTEFTTSESCGKCTPCREGLFQALKILQKVSDGKASALEIQQLQELGEVIKDTALCGLGQTGPNPVLTTLKYFRHEYEQHIKQDHCDAGVCSGLFVSPCENSCPLHINIPGFLTLFREDKMVEAYESILRENPLPASTGRICHFHCKDRCRRQDIDDSLEPGLVHRFIADTVYKTKKDLAIVDKLIKEKLPKTGKEIAIIGAGPAGLSAAFYLLRLGHDVVIFEEKAQAGGVLRYGIPEYRLPKKVLAKEVDLIKKLGAKFIFNKKIDAGELTKITKQYDALFVATGAYKSMPLGISGEDLKGVLSGTSFLEQVNLEKKPSIGKKVIVVGGGNVAIDAARTSRRIGADVTIVYRREKQDMPANKEEIKQAELEGIKFIFLAAPKTIIADNGKLKAMQVTKMKPGDYDSSGRRRPVATDEVFEISCDAVMLAIGEKVDSEFLNKIGVSINKDGTICVDEFSLKTNVDKIYAGGDNVRGPATAAEAMADGKLAASAIDYKLTGEDRFEKLFRKFEYNNIVPINPEGGHEQKAKVLNVNSRLNNFKEVTLGFSGREALLETRRCLRCDVK